MAGIRNSKTVDGVRYEYMTLNGKVMRQSWTEDGVDHVIDFAYDNTGSPYAFTYDGTTYYYVLNQQGDVIRIVNANGVTQVQYQYNAWGKVLGTTGELANINPIRYRGYYYDTETGFYYLQSRYYDPSIGRFINADQFASTGLGFVGCNMFAYCGNNPVNRVDYTGQFWSEIWEFTKIAVAETGKAMGLMSSAYAGCGGAAAVDGPLPLGDAIGIAGAALLTFGSIGYGIYQAVAAPATSIPKTEIKAEAIAIPTEPDNPVVFPANPLEFTPLGLVPVPKPGTKNGRFILWMDTITNTAVFRWDENINYENGPHFHIIGDPQHYYAGNLVPEPYASLYFPFN